MRATVILTMDVSMSNIVEVSHTSHFLQKNIHVLQFKVKETMSRNYARNYSSSFTVCCYGAYFIDALQFSLLQVIISNVYNYVFQEKFLRLFDV